MTADPDVLRTDDKVVEAWSELAHHHYRHLPVVDDGNLVGVVSIRDLLGVTQVRPATDDAAGVPRGLEGVVVAETSVGDVQGRAGFFHYRQYSATELAGPSLAGGRLAPALRRGPPRPGRFGPLHRRGRKPAGDPRRSGPHASRSGVDGPPLDALRTAVSLLGAELGWPPTHDIDLASSKDQALRLCAVIPTVLTALYRLQQGATRSPHDRTSPMRPTICGC